MKNLVLGIFIGFVFFGCVSATFSYKYYKPMLKTWEGTLLGATPEDDLDATSCSKEGSCVVMLKDTFFSMKLDYEDMQNRLQACSGD